MAEQPIYRFDVASLLDVMAARLGHTARSVALSLAAVAAYRDGPVENIPGVFMTTLVGGPPTSSVVSRDETSAWLVGAGLREGVDGLGVLCEDVWRTCCLAERAQAGPITIPQAVANDLRSIADVVLGKEAASVDRHGLSGKLDELQSRFGLTISWRDEIDSIVLARNCLTHRLGVVAERDLSDKDARVLRLRLRHHSLHVGTPDQPHVRLDRPGQEIQGGGSLFIRIGDLHERSFQVGERITLSSQEFMHLLTTLQHTGTEIVQSAAQYVARGGPKPPPTAVGPA